MIHKDSAVYRELIRAYRNNLRWIGVSDSARNVLAFLLAENQWTDESQSPEDISNETGLARSSISSIMSQLTGLGLVESEIDPTDEVVGRRKNLHTVSKGLSGLVMFGLRRLVLQLQDLAEELKTILKTVDKKDHAGREVLRLAIEEIDRNLRILTISTSNVMSKRTKDIEHSE